jgi:hypothetical protein
MACPQPANVVELSAPAKTVLARPRHMTINSIPVAEVTTAPGSATTLTVRALGTQVSANGPMAKRVLATLTYSPYSVVVGSAVRLVPPGWQHVTFGGITFSVPGKWTISRSTTWGGCPFNIQPGILALSTAQATSFPSCPAPPGTAGYLGAQPGMVLDSGPLVSRAPATATCLRRNGLQICIDPPPSPVGGFAVGHELNLLTAQINVPGQASVDQIELGLTGNGLAPLAIFDSMRPVG